MGSFAGYSGKTIISKGKKEEFTNNILKLLNYGGMVQFETVSIFGKSIALIKPIELNEEGKARFHYNYFEDEAWESAGYDANSNCFSSGKIGSNEFALVIIAAYFLCELYDEELGLTECNGDVVSDIRYIGWINQVLGTEFSCEKRYHIWEQYEKYCFRKMEYGYEWKEIIDNQISFIPKNLKMVINSGVDFSDIHYLRYGTGELVKDKILQGTYAEAVYQCKEMLKKYFGNDTDVYEQKKELLWEMLRKDKTERNAIAINEELQELAKLSLNTNARVFIYLTCELLRIDFWTEWKELKDKVYTDAIILQYEYKDFSEINKFAINRPVPALTTELFLYNDSYFVFHNTPEELINAPKYIISDDDRAYWWDGTNEVIFSDEMDKWLKELSERHKNHLEKLEETGETEDMLKLLLNVLYEAEKSYKRIFAYQNMFYEFLENSKDIRYIAAIQLFKELMQENNSCEKYIAEVTNWWTASRKVTFNEGRIRLKRYLAVMANTKLRKVYFGF